MSVKKLILITLALPIICGCEDNTQTPLPPAPAAIDPNSVLKSLSEAYENVAEKLMPSVVSISSLGSAEPEGSSSSDPGASPTPGAPSPNEFTPRGTGTGVVYDFEGHIVTNFHVISEALEVRVKLEDGKSFKAEVVGKEPSQDLALLKIDTSNLIPAVFGDSEALRVGEIVVAIGNPFGLEHSVTSGIVSGKSRSIFGPGEFSKFIQTDASINPGNSGGPLVNLNGEVIGINSAIFSRTGGYMGIGFAIPSNNVVSFVENLLKPKGTEKRINLDEAMPEVVK